MNEKVHLKIKYSQKKDAAKQVASFFIIIFK